MVRVIMPSQQYSVSGTAMMGWSGLWGRLGRLGLRVLAVVMTRPAHWGQTIFFVEASRKRGERGGSGGPWLGVGARL